jgi:hypothetical protein
MNTKILFAVLITAGFIACSKGKLATEPKLELVGVNTETVPLGGDLVISLKYRDKEGDVPGDTIYIKKYRINKKVLATNPILDSFAFKIPTAPLNPTGLLDITLDRATSKIIGAINPGNPPVPDTLRFKIWLKDAAKHVSDTVFVENIVVIR